MSEETGEWKLHTGIHKGTLISSDSRPARTCGPVRTFDTREEAIADYQEQRNWFKGIGYYIWFATLTSPDGTKTTLEQNPYR